MKMSLPPVKIARRGNGGALFKWIKLCFALKFFTKRFATILENVYI